MKVLGTISRADLQKLSKDSRIILWLDAQQNLVFSNLNNLLENDFPNDAAAAVGGIDLGDLYHTTGTVKVRIT